MGKAILVSLGALAAVSVLGLPAGAAAPEPVSGQADVRTLQSGLAERLQEAAQDLRPGGDRLQATRALDAARRLARIRQSLVDCPQAALEAPLDRVNAARAALQNGRTEAAAGILRQASQAAPAFQPAICPASASAVGKMVVDRRGEWIGRLVSLTPDGQAVLKVGGAINWFGFLDFANARRAVPAGRLVEGERMVVLLDG